MTGHIRTDLKIVYGTSLRGGEGIVIVAGGTHEGSFYARSEEEVRNFIDHVMNDLIQGGRTSDGFEIMPEYATVCIVGGEYPNETSERWPSNYLHVAVNVNSGYGALRWFSSEVLEGASEDHVSRFVWISENPDPPSFDPRLILDPPTPLYYPSEAALPVEKVREVLEEYCQELTGARPESIRWMLDQSSL
ncbi:Imm1 family immunity protein [Streptomyces sp. NPDC001930]|uniref:Imm1 family immunity protein n=1 Tax=Streptomyces sp. NPDC001930 TaxID=3364625 RepID=UPI0036A7A845